MTHISEQKQNERVDRQSLENCMRGDDIDRNRLIELESVAVEVVELEDLTEVEQHLRLHLERKVERAFYEAGKALMQLRDRRLYRSTHKTFEEYCRERFGFTRMAASYKIAAAVVIDNLSTNCLQNLEASTDGLQEEEMSTNCLQILPTNEYQIRPLTKLEPEQQRSVWQLSVEASGGKVPSGRVVKDIVRRVMERTKVPNPYRVSEVCQFVVKDNPELRGKGGYWCIVNQVNDFSCMVTSWDGECTVSIDHLKSMNYSDSDNEHMKEISDRLTQLRSNGNLEDAALAVLKHLGEVKRPYLTPLEEDLLSVLEHKYDVAQSTGNDVIP